MSSAALGQEVCRLEDLLKAIGPEVIQKVLSTYPAEALEVFGKCPGPDSVDRELPCEV